MQVVHVLCCVLAEILKREKAQRGIATICIGGGQGGAMLIENVSEVQHEQDTNL